MNVQSIEELEAEALKEELALEVEQTENETFQNEGLEVVDETVFLQMLERFVSTTATVVTSIFGVTPVSEPESQAVAKAGFEVLKCYPDFRPYDPKIMAWAGLGLTVSAVALPRVQEYKAKKPKASETTPKPELVVDNDDRE